MEPPDHDKLERLASIEPLTFDEAVKHRLQLLREAEAEFSALAAAIPEEAYTDAEVHILERASLAVEEWGGNMHDALEMVAAVSDAWYDILEAMQKATNALWEAVFVMRDVQRRLTAKGEVGGVRLEG
jgi:hypothetical protein